MYSADQPASDMPTLTFSSAYHLKVIYLLTVSLRDSKEMILSRRRRAMSFRFVCRLYIGFLIIDCILYFSAQPPFKVFSSLCFPSVTVTLQRDHIVRTVLVVGEQWEGIVWTGGGIEDAGALLSNHKYFRNRLNISWLVRLSGAMANGFMKIIFIEQIT